MWRPGEGLCHSGCQLVAGQGLQLGCHLLGGWELQGRQLGQLGRAAWGRLRLPMPGKAHACSHAGHGISRSACSSQACCWGEDRGLNNGPVSNAEQCDHSTHAKSTRLE